MKDIIDYYEDGGPSSATPAEAKEFREEAKDWIEKLQQEFYDNANPLGRQAMYMVLKQKHPTKGKYPTNRFIAAWLRRHASNQVNRTAPKNAPSIQSVITS